MYVVAFNGSPRSGGNTAVLLERALAGASSRGAETELVHLGQVVMRGCQACYSCKRPGPGRARCSQSDGMTGLYPRIERADGILLGSPIYFGTISAATKAFIERLFCYFNWGRFPSSFPGKVRVGLIVTMGAEEQHMEKAYRQHIELNQTVLSRTLGSVELLTSTDTMHLEDYSSIVADALQPLVGRKLEHRRTAFPEDCRKAFDLGVRLVQE